MTDSLRRRVTRRHLALAVLALTLTSCAASDDTAGQKPTSNELTTATLTSPIATAESEAGLSILEAALQRYESGYAFTSEVTIRDVTAVSVHGVQVGTSSRMRITSGDGMVEYLKVGSDQWARTGEGAWDLVAEDEVTSPPLEPFHFPTLVSVVDDQDGDYVLSAVYPAPAFGSTGPDLEVTLTIDHGRLASASYSTTVQGTVATVVTGFRDLTLTTPIAAP